MKLILFILIAALAGCAHLPDTCVEVTPRTTYCVQGRAGIEPFTALQELKTTDRDKTDRYLVGLEVDRTSFRIAIMTMLGQNLGSFRYDEPTNTSLLMPGTEKRFNALLPVALVQLALWPKENIQHGLAAGAIEIQEGSGWRILRDEKGKILLKMDYEGSTRPFRQVTMTAPEGPHVVITTLRENDE